MPSHAPAPRTRPLLAIIRNNVLGLIALAFVVAPSSYALAAASSTEAKTTRICVTKGSMLRYVASPGECRTGEKSFFVSRRGVQGLRGVRGAAGAAGPAGVAGANGAVGPQGIPGATGAPGTPGVAATQNFAQYYAPVDAYAYLIVAPNANVPFEQEGPHQGTISRATPTTFTLGTVGTYRVAFDSSSAGGQAQLQLMVDDIAVPYATFGHWGGCCGDMQVSGEALITTTVVNSTLSIRNVGGSDMYLESNIGVAGQSAASLVIQQLS
jgi:hypothetical protein